MNKRINNPFKKNLEKIATPEKGNHDKLLSCEYNPNYKSKRQLQG
jgi:hypothetical protein